ncbi:right-handed parallel beta-helix repeat-containing protein [Micromonospora sp. DR5-3]|uniref:right-handed parallel beta-helix repeat-containing protein n=1 Tax=unclassified Micromonospora TaxID=2617518 RepID=UPI0011D4CD2C|nr:MULTISPECIES: right-handed parallel beta-helix repeat-containing protein [unclassified Micromonospora]MCW3819330.1 right-handed parallel beta-helix repeat-containing protein [Micromonospora sp. DR5-3]TYC21767.1 right-handed parallel beta-helix repeat-containing protein [Micromonospora sp. MP36]
MRPPRATTLPAAGLAADPFVHNARDHGLAGDGTTNDQPALQRLVDELGAGYAADGQPRTIYCPSGLYSIRDKGTVWRSGVSLIGAGPAATRFALANPGDPTSPTPLAFFTVQKHGASRDNHIADCTFAHFEIDGSGVRLSQYDVLAKGLGLQYVWRGRFHDLYIHDTAATGFGCDFLQDTFVDNLLIEHCGRLENGEWMGGAGIGIGVGGWGPVERCTVNACTTIRNGTSGIFFELQGKDWTPPRGIRVIGCHSEGNRFGISDWGTDGLIVSGCTLIGNHQAGYDVSSLGTTSVAGRGGIVTGCVIEDNVWDGVAIGNTPGPYTVEGNRISRNGRYGYWQHNLAGGAQEPATDMIIKDNEFWDNALEGILADSSLADVAIAGNRIRNNGRRTAPASSGAGDTVTYTERSLTDTSANWVPDGHRGKWITADGRRVIVMGNSATKLVLAPRRPGAPTAWPDRTPPPGAPYQIPGSPPTRAGITLAAATYRPTIHNNRVWDSQPHQTQTHGLQITGTGTCESGWVHDNYWDGNAVAAARFDTPPSGGCWYHNIGLDDDPGAQR